MVYTYKMTGIRAAIERLEAIRNNPPRKISNAVAAAGRQMQFEARDNAPVDTGTLVKSIQFRMSGPSSATVEAKAGYAGFVEFGTSKQRPQPFFIPAFVVTQQEFTKELRKILAAA